MSNDNVVSLAAPATFSDPLTDLLRAVARWLIEAAVAAEFEDLLSAFEREKLADGRRRVVRNGHLPERQILTGIGAVDVRGAEGTEPLWSAGTVPVLAGAAVRAPQCERGCGGSVAVPARGVDGSDAFGRGGLGR